LSTMATMAIGFGVWTHHMFATGMSDLALSFFSGVSIIIAVPSAVTVFAWIATIWTGRPVFTTAFHYFAGMIALFVIGGVAGFMTGSVPVDWQLTDTYFVVAHLHYVLIGINVFPVVGAIYMWFPKVTGRLLDIGLALDKGRQMLGTTVIDAEPAVILQMPFDSYAPLTLAVGTAIIFFGMLNRSWPDIGIGVIVTGIALLLWLWPGRLREGSPEPANEPP